MPVQAEPKHNKRGLGAKPPAKRKAAQPQATASGHSEKVFVIIPFKSCNHEFVFSILSRHIIVSSAHIISKAYI